MFSFSTTGFILYICKVWQSCRKSLKLLSILFKNKINIWNTVQISNENKLKATSFSNKRRKIKSCLSPTIYSMMVQPANASMSQWSLKGIYKINSMVLCHFIINTIQGVHIAMRKVQEKHFPQIQTSQCTYHVNRRCRILRRTKRKKEGVTGKPQLKHN